MSRLKVAAAGRVVPSFFSFFLSIWQGERRGKGRKALRLFAGRGEE